MKVCLRNKDGYIKLNKDSVKVVENKSDATEIELSQLKDTAYRIYSTSSMIGRLLTEVIK